MCPQDLSHRHSCQFYFTVSCWHDEVTASRRHALCRLKSTQLRSREAKGKTMTTSDEAVELREDDVISFVCLFSAWPLLLTAVSLPVWGWQFTSVYLDSRLLLFGYESWLLFSFPSGDAGRQLLWLQYVVAQRDTLQDNFFFFTSEMCFFCLSVSLSLMRFCSACCPFSLISLLWITVMSGQGCLVKDWELKCKVVLSCVFVVWFF